MTSPQGPVAGFAAQLRELRDRAGRPSYRQLAHYSHTALSQAAAGRCLPSLAVTQAFVGACGGDVEEWSDRWREVDQTVRPPGEPEARPEPRPAAGPGPAGAQTPYWPGMPARAPGQAVFRLVCSWSAAAGTSGMRS